MVSLRPFAESDAAAAFEAIAESVRETSPWIGILNGQLTQEDVARHFANEQKLREERKEYNFSIIDTESDTIVGGSGINHINWSHKNANLYYWIRSTRTGKGFASEAVREVARFGFQSLGLIRTELIIAVDNTASARVAEKVGALREGRMRAKIRVGDVVQDAFMYSLLPADIGVH